MWDKVKQFATVALFTLLIWFAADQNVEDERTYEFMIRAVSADPGRYVNLVEQGGQVKVRLTLKGLRRHLDAFENTVTKTPVMEAVIDSTEEASLLEKLPQTKELLLKVREIDESKLRIMSVTPESVKLRVDEFEVIPDVAVRPTFGDVQVTNVECTPSRVSVRLPRFAAEALKTSRVLRPNAEGLLRERDDVSGDDRPFQGEVRLSYEAPAPVDIVPREVTVSGMVESLTDRKTLRPVVVVYLVPDAVQREFVVESAAGSKFNLDVEVTGSKNLLQQVDARDVRGYVEVKAQDMESAEQEIERPVEFMLPAGIKLVPKTPAPTVRFKLVRITTGGDGNGE